MINAENLFSLEKTTEVNVCKKSTFERQICNMYVKNVKINDACICDKSWYVFVFLYIIVEI